MDNFFCNHGIQKSEQIPFTGISMDTGFFGNHEVQKSEQTPSIKTIDTGGFFCNHETQKSNPEYIFSEIDSNYRREFSKGKSFKVSIWNEVDTYNNDDFIQDFVIYNQALWARIDPTPSINEIPTEPSWAMLLEGVAHIEFEERDNKVYWKYEDEAEWKLLFSGVSSETLETHLTDYVKKENLVKINGQEIYNGGDITIEMDEGVSDDILISEDIRVTGGPLSQFLIDAGIETIEKGMNLQDLFVSLFCHEEWPKIQSDKGTITPSTSMEVSVYPDKTGLVLPGTQIKFTAERSDLPAPSTTNSTVKGFTYGYSESKEGADKTGKNIEKRWSVTKMSSNYTMSLSCGNSQKSSTNKTDSITIQAQVGENVCTANASGTVKYSASIDEIPSYYIISSLGNKDDEHKSDPVFADSKSVTCSASDTAQSTVTCAYPCYSNVNGTQLSNVTTTQHHKDTNTFTISSVPATSETNPFIFEFPASHNITSFTKKFLHEKYKCYTNISGEKLIDTVNSETTFNKLKEITVPSETISQRNFVLYFVSGLDTPTIKIKDAFEKWQPLSDKVYRITKNAVKRDGVDYDKFETIDGFSGNATYEFTFTPKSEENDVFYKTVPIEKVINGDTYQYNRLITTGTSGIVDRKITFNKKMSEK